MWKLLIESTVSLGIPGTFTGRRQLFLNPRMLGGTLAFNYQKPFIGLKIDLFKGLSYKTTWNYYGYNLKTPTDVPGFSQSGQRTSTAVLLRSARVIRFEMAGMFSVWNDLIGESL